jgi:hypothetical protein
VFTNQKWDRLKESHLEDVTVHWQAHLMGQYWQAAIRISRISGPQKMAQR